MELYGRKKIVTNREINNEKDVALIIKEALSVHLKNVSEMKVLFNYVKGETRIYNKKNEQNPNINNQVSINNAAMIVRKFLGYFLSDEIKFVSRKAKKTTQKEIDKLNDFIYNLNKHKADMECYSNSATCGVGYMCVLRDEETLFKVHSLNPLTTFIVYSNNIGEDPILACSYRSKYINKQSYYEITAYDKQFIYKVDIPTTAFFDRISEDTGNFIFHSFNFENKKCLRLPHFYNGIPFVEFPSNQLRIGKFEIAIDLLDAINMLESNALDDVENTIRSVLLLFGLPEETIQELQNRGLGANNLICFDGRPDIKQAGEFISPNLNADTVKNLREALDSKMREVVGIPDRKTRGGGGGDTMGAVKLRDGWADIEEVAKIDEGVWRSGQKEIINLILGILKESKELSQEITTKDINVKFSRNKNDDLYVKATTGKILFDMGVPLEQISIVMGLTNDSAEFASLWGENIDQIKNDGYWGVKKQEETVEDNKNKNNFIENKEI